MNSKGFRKLALGLKDTVESSHMDHPDFRVGGKIFATLKHGQLTGMVVLTPEQQREFIEEDPETFSTEAGAWGRAGCTKVLLESADEDSLGRALTLARQNILNKIQQAKKKPARKQPKL